MPSINTSDITRASDSTYFVDIARVKKLYTYLLTYLIVAAPVSVITSQHMLRLEMDPEVMNLTHELGSSLFNLKCMEDFQKIHELGGLLFNVK
jgi:hypothetical protein